MGLSAVLTHPVSFLLTAIEGSILQYGLVVLSANRVGDLPQLVVVRYMVLKLPSGLEGYGIE